VRGGELSRRDFFSVCEVDSVDDERLLDEGVRLAAEAEVHAEGFCRDSGLRGHRYSFEEFESVEIERVFDRHLEILDVSRENNKINDAG